MKDAGKNLLQFVPVEIGLWRMLIGCQPRKISVCIQ